MSRVGFALFRNYETKCETRFLGFGGIAKQSNSRISGLGFPKSPVALLTCQSNCGGPYGGRKDLSGDGGPYYLLVTAGTAMMALARL